MHTLQLGTGVDWEKEEREIIEFLARGKSRKDLERKLEWGGRLIALDKHFRKDGGTLVEWAERQRLNTSDIRMYMMAFEFFEMDHLGDGRVNVELTHYGYRLLTRMPEDLGRIAESVLRFLGAETTDIKNHIYVYEEQVAGDIKEMPND